MQGGKKLERARDLFEQALDGCPAKFAKRELIQPTPPTHTHTHTHTLSHLTHTHTALYLLYAQLEEDHGLARHAMAVYDRATKAVTPDEQFEVRYNVILQYTKVCICVCRCSTFT